MRKIGILLFSLLFLFIFSACSSSEEESSASEEGEEDIIEAEVQDASYIISGQDDGEPVEDKEGGLMQINVQMENISDKSAEISPEMDVQLYDGDNQIDPSNDTYPAIGLEMETNNSIGAGKQKDFDVLFDVEKDKEYDLVISPMSSDYEIEAADATASLDTSEYNESLETLEDPAMALEAHIETIYLDKDNSDYEKLVSADKNDLQDEALDEFGDMLDETLSSDVSDSDIEKYYESYRDELADESEIETNIKAHANDQAIVELEYSTFSSMDLSDKIREYKDKYMDKHDEMTDVEDEEEYALSKFDKIVDELDIEDSDLNLEFLMKEEDGNWVIDDSHSNEEKDLRSAFAEGSI